MIAALLAVVALAAEPSAPSAGELEAAPAAQTGSTDLPAGSEELLAEEPGSAADVRVNEEITVWADFRVEQAQRKVVEGLKQQGYTNVLDRGDYVLLRNEQPWKGEVRVYDDGWILIKRQAPRLEAPPTGRAARNSPAAWAGCLLHPLKCVKLGGVTVSERKLRAQRIRTLAVVETDVRALGDRVADRETEKRVDELPERLEALWYDGVPLAGANRLETDEAKKRALLSFWDSRTDTVWGDRVRVAVEAFLRAVVQTSDAALTDAEIAAFNERRGSARALDLTRPWDEVMAEVQLDPPVQ